LLHLKQWARHGIDRKRRSQHHPALRGAGVSAEAANPPDRLLCAGPE
jgi:hypothetical protein